MSMSLIKSLDYQQANGPNGEDTVLVTWFDGIETLLIYGADDDKIAQVHKQIKYQQEMWDANSKVA